MTLLHTERLRAFDTTLLRRALVIKLRHHGDVLLASPVLSSLQRVYDLAAEAALARGKRTSTAHLLLSPLLRFVKFYVLRRGFLDGVPGLVHILIGCGASFAKHAKMLQAQRETT